MDDIGSTDDTALLCHTNEPSRRDSEGDWFAPNGTKVGNYADSMPRDVAGFGKTRSPHVVRLKRSSDGTPPEGTYKCVVRDTKSINQAVYGGIYSMHYVWCALFHFADISSSALFSSSPIGDSVTLTSSVFMTSEVDVAISTSTTESTTSSHSTPTLTVIYTSSEGTTTPTSTVVFGTSGEIKTINLTLDYTSSATATQTLPTAIRQVMSTTTPTPFNSSSSNGNWEDSIVDLTNIYIL